MENKPILKKFHMKAPSVQLNLNDLSNDMIDKEKMADQASDHTM